MLLILTAAINGAGAGILWVAQGKFISDCACKENVGFFNSYFWAFFMASQITGNVTAGLVLKQGEDQSLLFIVFAVLAVVGSCSFLCLGKPKKGEGSTVDISAVEETTPWENI